MGHQKKRTLTSISSSDKTITFSAPPFPISAPILVTISWSSGPPIWFISDSPFLPTSSSFSSSSSQFSSELSKIMWLFFALTALDFCGRGVDTVELGKGACCCSSSWLSFCDCVFSSSWRIVTFWDWVSSVWKSDEFAEEKDVSICVSWFSEGLGVIGVESFRGASFGVSAMGEKGGSENDYHEYSIYMVFFSKQNSPKKNTSQ